MTNLKSLLGIIAISRLFVGLQAMPTTPALPTNVCLPNSLTHPPLYSSSVQGTNFLKTNLKQVSRSLRQSGELVIIASGSRRNGTNDAPDYNNNDYDRKSNLARMNDVETNDAETPIIVHGGTIVWEVQNGVLKRTDISDFTTLRSDKCYVLLQKSIDEATGSVITKISYWIGKNSSYVDAAKAADQAIMLDAEIHPVTQIQREVEGQESLDFQVIFKRTNKTTHITTITTDVSTKIDENRKRMFVIGGEDEPDFREVELSCIHVLGNDNKCLVIVSNKVYVACRRGASKRHEKSAKELASIMMNRKELRVEKINIRKIDNLFSGLSKEEQEDLRQYFAELGKIQTDLAKQQIPDNPEQFNYEELRRVTDQTYVEGGKPEFFRMKMTRIYMEEYENIKEEEINYPNLPTVLLNTKDCYLIDTRSNLGLIVWMGEDSEVRLRRECAQRAEIYKAKNGYDYATPIIFVDQKGIPLVSAPNVQSLIHLIHIRGADNEQPTENDTQLNFTIWIVKEGQPERISPSGTALKSNKSYVLVQNSVDETSKTTASTFYWVGQDSPKEDAADAAAYAVELDSRVHRTPQIQREAEGHETQVFRSSFERLSLSSPNVSSIKKKNKVEISLPKKSSKKIGAKRKRMFSIGGKPNRIIYEEVALSYTNVLGNDHNCFVFLSTKVYVVCANWATTHHQKVAKELAKLMGKRRNVKVEEIIKVHRLENLFSPQLLEEEEEDLRQFFAEFDRIPIEEAEQQIADNPEIFKPEEVRRILGQTAKQNDGSEYFIHLKAFRIYEDFNEIVKEDYLGTFELKSLEELNATDCYLIDSQSTVGLFVWMGKESRLLLRQASAKKAEIYLKDQEYSNTTFVTYLSQEDVPLDIQSVQSMVYNMNPENEISGTNANKKSNLRKGSVHASKLPARRATNEAINSEKLLGRGTSLEEIVRHESETLENPLNFSQIVQLLENSKKNDISAKEALEAMQLPAINPETIVKQLDTIYSNVEDRSTKIRITKLKNKINQDFLNGR